MHFTTRMRIAGLFAVVGITAASGVAYFNRDRSVPVRPLVWSSCGHDFDCSSLEVPIDYNHPNGKTIILALTRLPAGDATHRIGSLVLNPGGPGASGIDFAHEAMLSFPAAVRARFDIVGFDPRGVGQSAPVVCDDGTVSPSPAVTATPDSAAAGDRPLTAVAAYTEGCRRNTGDELSHVDTVSSARDIERIRVALGETSLSYFGYSYGSLLGATYADLYPSHVRAFVLDGAIDPRLNYEDFQQEQALAAETALQSFFADCASRPECPFHNDGNPQAHFESLRQSLNGAPLVVPYPSGAVLSISGYALNEAARLGLYSSAGWKALAQALADAEFRGDGKGLATLLSFEGPDPGSRTARNFESAGTVIDCLDRPIPDTNELDQFYTKLTAEAPHFGYGSIAEAAYCWSFNLPRNDAPHALHAKGSAPILVVGTKGDPVTPYTWAQSLAGQLSSGRLLTWSGYGHTASFHVPSVSTCIDSAVTAYLVDLVLPDDGKICD
jgi:pimeloyl-ACP methyl ester carboxylesterase